MTISQAQREQAKRNLGEVIIPLTDGEYTLGTIEDLHEDTDNNF